MNRLQKRKKGTESEIVTNTSTLERKSRAARKERERRKRSLEIQERLSSVSRRNIQKKREKRKLKSYAHTIYLTGDKQHAKGRESTKKERKGDNKYN